MIYTQTPHCILAQECISPGGVTFMTDVSLRPEGYTRANANTHKYTGNTFFAQTHTYVYFKIRKYTVSSLVEQGEIPIIIVD